VGEHEIGDFSLTVQSVPPDALGGPARVRLSIDRTRAGLEGAWSRGDLARLVLEDAIVRAASRALDELAGPSPGSAPGSGRVWIEPPGPDLACRTVATVGDERLDLALAIDLPAAARRVRGLQAEEILFEHLPRVGMAALLFPLRRLNEVRSVVAAVARRNAAAELLAARGLAALVPSAALPGRTPTTAGGTTLETPEGPVSGLAIPTGITLFVTNGIAGAGAWLRDLVAPSAATGRPRAILAGPVATLRSSRRAFGPVDVRAFVKPCADVPNPEAYVTEDGPAPLTVAASLIEAIEAGARIIVLDEDELPAGAFSPAYRLRGILGGEASLVPLAERLPELRDRWGLSFLIAARAAGSLWDLADSVFVVDDDRIADLGEAAVGLRRNSADRPRAAARALVARPAARSMRIATEGPPGKLKASSWGSRGVRIGDDLVDLRDTTLVRDVALLRAVAALMKRAVVEATVWRSVEDVLDALETATERPTFDRLEEPGLVGLTRPTRIEIAAALVRWKRVTFRVAAATLGATAEDPQ
jgi:predicted ABC-class ATPase